MDVPASTGSEPHTNLLTEAPSSRPDRDGERALARWGGAAGLGGVVLMLLTLAVVIGPDLPAASDSETLTDFADIETGRIPCVVGRSVVTWHAAGAVVGRGWSCGLRRRRRRSVPHARGGTSRRAQCHR